MEMLKGVPGWLIGTGLICCAALVGALVVTDSQFDTPWGNFKVEKAKDPTYWHVVSDAKPFELNCEYKILIEDFFSRGSPLVVDATMVSHPQISAFFFGGSGANNFGLFVKSDSKTTSWQGQEGANPRPVKVLAKCMPVAK